MTGGAGAPRADAIVVILTDQQRQRAWWPDGVRLPAFDALARDGLSLTRAYTPSALCTPARAALFTGLHASAVGMDDNINFGWQPSLAPGTVTLGTRLAQAGVRASYLGKWHLARDRELASGPPGLARYGFEDWSGPDRHGRPHEGTRSDPGLAADAVRWLERQAGDGRPFCLVVSFVNPHDIMFSPRFRRPTRAPHAAPYPASFDDDLRTKPSIQRRFRRISQLVAGWVPPRRGGRWQEFLDAYVDYHLAVDRAVGTVLEALDRLGLARRTAVVATSDHGELGGAHGLRGKGPTVYEESARVPLVVRWPGRVAPGTSAALWSGIDLAPTLLGLVGAPAEARADLPGVDQTPVWRGEAGAAREAVLFQYRARATLGLPWSRARGFVVGRSDGRTKYARYVSRLDAPFAPETVVEEERYDLVADPDELRNLAPRGPRRAGEVDGVEAGLALATEALARREGAAGIGLGAPARQ